MKNELSWYSFEGMERVDSPVLVVFPDRVKQNIQTAIELVGNPARLRPHAKTHKSPDLTRLLLEAGIHQFKCSTIAEAEMLASEGVEDILLAYQLTGPKIDRFLQLQQAYPGTRFSSLVDNAGSAVELRDRAVNLNSDLFVYLDLDVGMHRTGCLPDEAAVGLCKELNQMEGIRLTGLHAYDGHISDPDPVLRKQRIEQAFDPVFKLKTALLAEGISGLELIAGGMPSFPFLAENPELICSPGTFVYWDQSYSEKIADTSFIPAAVVLSRIISKPAPNRITTDLGHKSIASENSLDKRVHWLNAGSLLPVGHSEEHFFFESPNAAAFEIGTLLVGLPWHICPTVALYESAITVASGKINGVWRITARDRRLSI